MRKLFVEKVIDTAGEFLDNNQRIKESKIEILPNYYHGDFSINNPEQYISAINTLITSRDKQLKTEINGNTGENFENAKINDSIIETHLLFLKSFSIYSI